MDIWTIFFWSRLQCSAFVNFEMLTFLENFAYIPFGNNLELDIMMSVYVALGELACSSKSCMQIMFSLTVNGTAMYPVQNGQPLKLDVWVRK